jgi:hypothetical protein
MGRKLTARQVARIRRLRYEDGLSGPQVAALIGCNPATVTAYAPGRPGKVPVAPLREAFLRSGVTAGQVATELDWLDRGSPDASRVNRALGITDTISHGRRHLRSMVDAEIVMLIADAIGVGAWEVLPDIEDERRAA